MEKRPCEQGAREFRRRALRFQKHRLPRRAAISSNLRLLAWMMMLVSIGIALVALAQYAPV